VGTTQPTRTRAASPHPHELPRPPLPLPRPPPGSRNPSPLHSTEISPRKARIRPGFRVPDPVRCPTGEGLQNFGPPPGILFLTDRREATANSMGEQREKREERGEVRGAPAPQAPGARATPRCGGGGGRVHLAGAVVVNELELPDVAVLLHHPKELDHDLRHGPDKHLREGEEGAPLIISPLVWVAGRRVPALPGRLPPIAPGAHRRHRERITEEAFAGARDPRTPGGPAQGREGPSPPEGLGDCRVPGEESVRNRREWANLAGNTGTRP